MWKYCILECAWGPRCRCVTASVVGTQRDWAPLPLSLSENAWCTRACVRVWESYSSQSKPHVSLISYVQAALPSSCFDSVFKPYPLQTLGYSFFSSVPPFTSSRPSSRPYPLSLASTRSTALLSFICPPPLPPPCNFWTLTSPLLFSSWLVRILFSVWTFAPKFIIFSVQTNLTYLCPPPFLNQVRVSSFTFKAILV